MGKSKKYKLVLSSKPEKIITAASFSLALAILFDNKKGKKDRGGKGKNPNLIARFLKNYSVIDALLAATIAKKAVENERRLAKEKEFKTKLRDLEVESSIPFEL
ncbi:MAG: hypothetical protein J5994_06610 [Ruminococcus sp.]|nr:hypothetical protein [Ruminococcus sp.]